MGVLKKLLNIFYLTDVQPSGQKESEGTVIALSPPIPSFMHTFVNSAWLAVALKISIKNVVEIINFFILNSFLLFS